MLIHHYDPITKIYTHSEESESLVDNSTDLSLPELTYYYTVAFIDNKWVSVLKPGFEVQNNIIVDLNNNE